LAGLFCLGAEEISRLCQRVDRYRESMEEGGVGRIQRLQRVGIESHRVPEEETEILGGGSGARDIVATAVDRRGRRLHLRQTDSAFGISISIANDWIGRRCITNLDR